MISPSAPDDAPADENPFEDMFGGPDIAAALQDMKDVDDIFTWLVTGEEKYNPSEAILLGIDRDYLHSFLDTAPRTFEEYYTTRPQSFYDRLAEIKKRVAGLD